MLYKKTWFKIPSLKSAWNLVYPRQNRDVREILRNLIGCFYYKKSKPRIDVIVFNFLVIKTSDADPIFKILEKEVSCIDFTMCNPPFFAETEGEKSNDRTTHRPLPNSISTATESEKVTEGGEVAFVRRMIAESLECKHTVR